MREVVDDRELAASMLAEQRRNRVRYGRGGMVKGWLELYAALSSGR